MFGKNPYRNESVYALDSLLRKEPNRKKRKLIFEWIRDKANGPDSSGAFYKLNEICKNRYRYSLNDEELKLIALCYEDGIRKGDNQCAHYLERTLSENSLHSDEELTLLNSLVINIPQNPDVVMRCALSILRNGEIRDHIKQKAGIIAESTLYFLKNGPMVKGALVAMANGRTFPVSSYDNALAFYRLAMKEEAALAISSAADAIITATGTAGEEEKLIGVLEQGRKENPEIVIKASEKVLVEKSLSPDAQNRLIEVLRRELPDRPDTGFAIIGNILVKARHIEPLNYVLLAGMYKRQSPVRRPDGITLAFNVLKKAAHLPPDAKQLLIDCLEDAAGRHGGYGFLAVNRLLMEETHFEHDERRRLENMADGLLNHENPLIREQAVSMCKDIVARTVGLGHGSLLMSFARAVISEAETQKHTVEPDKSKPAKGRHPKL